MKAPKDICLTIIYDIKTQGDIGRKIMATRIGKDGTIIRDNWNQPGRNITPQHYTRPEPEYNYTGRSPFGFYVRTLVFSALVSWLLSGLVSVLVFDPNKAEGWLSGVTAFINNISPYLIFLAGIGGCFWYNTKHATFFGASETFLSVLSAFVACLIVGVALFLLSLVIKIVIVIVIVIIAISIFAGS